MYWPLPSRVRQLRSDGPFLSSNTPSRDTRQTRKIRKKSCRGVSPSLVPPSTPSKRRSKSLREKPAMAANYRMTTTLLDYRPAPSVVAVWLGHPTLLLFAPSQNEVGFVCSETRWQPGPKVDREAIFSHAFLVGDRCDSSSVQPGVAYNPR